MKAHLICAGIALLACGCSKPESANADVEVKVKKAVETATKAQRDEIAGLKKRIAALEGSVSTLSSAPAGNAPSVRRPTPSIRTDEQKMADYEANGYEGVPPDIFAEILRKAKQGGSMGSYTVESEAKGYLEFRKFSTAEDDVPKAVREQLVAMVQREQAGSWAGMTREINQQINDWRTIEGWKKDGVPGLAKEEGSLVISLAAKKYPTDWGMQRYEINNQAKEMSKQAP